MTKENYDSNVIDDFGDEWDAYDQSTVDSSELEKQFLDYFKLFSWDERVTKGIGADFGCGSGRWAKFVADRVKTLICIDASEKAANVAKRNLADKTNCQVMLAKVDELPMPDNSLDFAYSLGVLHHIPDTAEAIKNCTDKLKSGAPFLIYLYYAFDNRPKWFAFIWKCSDVFRSVISKMPFFIKYPLSNVIAAFVYYPLARLTLLIEKLGMDVSNVPLTEYRAKSFYTMRTDALDRFGTRLENRFTQVQIKKMMEDAGLKDIKFSDIAPYWCVLGIKQ
ncbi:MAG: class I SAM-dependent methyltransferase [Proteobacteria bacterium]|nr:class I SAM-dependent methyltransferase [Pseudomonadota bacterium]NOG59048.1 class I SAM-dependent methyltransferase [Pseudomonadota bacterium]